MYTTFFLAKKCHEKNIFPIFMHEKSRCDDIAAAFVCSFCVPALPHDVKCT